MWQLAQREHLAQNVSESLEVLEAALDLDVDRVSGQVIDNMVRHKHVGGHHLMAGYVHFSSRVYQQ